LLISQVIPKVLLFMSFYTELYPFICFVSVTTELTSLKFDTRGSVLSGEFNFRQEQRYFLFATASRLALVPIGGSYPGGKAAWDMKMTTDFYVVPSLKMRGVTLPPHGMVLN